jgi:hypothetical protein
MRTLFISARSRLLALLLSGPVACSTSTSPESPDAATTGADAATTGPDASAPSSAGGATSSHDAGGTTNSRNAGGSTSPRGAGGASAGGGLHGSGGTIGASGGATGSGGKADSGTLSGCSAPGLVWKSAQKTNYTSYPDPGSEECIKYNGCMYAGEFAGCSAKEPESWVMAHDIVAVFPDFDSLKLHDLCLRSAKQTIVVTVLDECADSDCSGCCTQNQGSADELIDVEKYTDQRWGVDDGPIEWADLGPTRTAGCN